MKLLYARAFQAPSSADLSGFAIFVPDPDGVEPEVMDTIEIMYHQRGAYWTQSLGLFASFLDDQIEFLPTTGGSLIVNRSDSEARGIEYSLEYERNEWQARFQDLLWSLKLLMEKVVMKSFPIGSYRQRLIIILHYPLSLGLHVDYMDDYAVNEETPDERATYMRFTWLAFMMCMHYAGFTSE